MSHPLSRRTVLSAVLVSALAPCAGRAQGKAVPGCSLPIGLPGAFPGDGFFVRHGYATENTWYNPGWLHTAEDWYALEGDTAGAEVYAIADGAIVFAGSDYPGLVVIVRHADDLYSMYGHLDEALAHREGSVRRGQLLGTMLARTDGRAPSHLHVEVRTFLTTSEVNGDSPRYGYACGYQCPPGPGYWPMDAPEHPSSMGWRNPTHVTWSRMFGGEAPPAGAEVVVPAGARQVAPLWSAPADDAGAKQVGELPLVPGDRLPLLAVVAGPEDTRGESAEAYRLWCQVEAPDAGTGWVQAAVPSTNDTMSDGRPASIRFDLLPAVAARGAESGRSRPLTTSRG